MRLDRIIFASDLHSNYIQFWPITSRIWRYVTGARPTLFFVAPIGTPIDQVEGCDVIHVPPFPDLPTCFIAQTIRLLAPSWFPNEVCAIADIDLFMINRTFFPTHLQQHASDKLVILNRYPAEDVARPSLCYHVSSGKVFAELFQVKPGPKDMQTEIFPILQQWYQTKKGQWATDEMIMHEKVGVFKKNHPQQVVEFFTPNLWKKPTRSVSHYAGFKVNTSKLRDYVEVEPPYPYEMNKSVIHQVVRMFLPGINLDEIRVLQKGVQKQNRHPHKSVNGQARVLNVTASSESRLRRLSSLRRLRTLRRTHH